MTRKLATVPGEQVAAVAVAVLLGFAIAERRGTYTPEAILYVLGALVLLAGRFGVGIARGRAGSPRAFPAVPAVVVWAALAWLGIAGLRDHALLIYGTSSWAPLRAAQWTTLGLLATYLPFLVGERRDGDRIRLVRFALVAAAVLAAAAAVVRIAPAPRIDVWSMQTEGARALLAGKNPFTAVGVGATAISGPRVVPYVYPPAQVLLSVPGYLLGDVRYSMVAGLLACGIALRAIARRLAPDAPSLAQDAPAFLVWLQPKAGFVIEQGWTEPLALGLALAAAASHLHGRRWLAAVLLGLAVASKQQMIWLAILVPVLLRFEPRQIALAGAVAAATVLPFLLADPAALKLCLFDYQRLLPPRKDGLVFGRWAGEFFHRPMPGALPAFVLAGSVVAAALARLPRSPAALGLAAAAAYLVFSAFNKWAFTNYYFFVAGLGALWAATAARVESRS